MKLPLVLTLVAATALPFAGAALVQASEQQDAYLEQLAQCAMLLLTDPVKQAEVCGSRDGRSDRTMPEIPDTPPPSSDPSSFSSILLDNG